MKYAIVYFGSPSGRTVRSSVSLSVANRIAVQAKGAGSCTAARVYECESDDLARTADISVIRSGERVVFEA